MRIYVGNLPFQTGDEDLQGLFQEYGEVTSTSVVCDRETGHSQGFGFVEMATGQEAQTAITGLSGKEVGGRPLTVNEARTRQSDSGIGGGGRMTGMSSW